MGLWAVEPAAYNREMLHSLNALLAPALAERLTLLINHVLSSESIAMDRLRPHSGATLALHLPGWPALLPAPPVLAWRVTPAGLLDWVGAEPSLQNDLAITLDASNPAALLTRMLSGEQPQVQIVGNAQLAGDINWLLHNLRWDVAADLERIFGARLAEPLHQIGRMLAQAMRGAFQAATALSEQLRSRRAS